MSLAGFLSKDAICEKECLHSELFDTIREEVSHK